VTTWRGSCHCGAVRFEADGAIEWAELCNCSICSRKAYVHWYVPRERFRLLTPWSELATYRFGTGAAAHHFCTRCGIAPFYEPRSDPDKIDVNLRCVAGVDLDAVELRAFDGRNWEEAFARSRGEAAEGS
jgi:centromere protein V